MGFLELDNISFKYPEENNDFVIFGFSHSFDYKDVVKLSGRNGSGKSTLLKLIAGELTPNAGTVVSKANPVYLNQDASLFLSSHLTIHEQLFLTLKGNRYFRNNGENYIRELLSKYELNLDNRMNEFIGHLSGGQKQIVALLAVLLGGYDLLCLDEFTAGMDEISKNTSVNLLQTFIATNAVCVVEVSHSNSLGLNYNSHISLEI